jgi:hypothetical protein
MSQYELCKLFRFVTYDKPLYKLLQGDTGKYFAKRLREMGGFTAAISKALGWTPGKEIGF